MVVWARFVSGLPSVPVVGSVYDTVMVDFGGFTCTFVVVPHLVHALELGGAIIPSMKLAPQPAKGAEEHLVRTGTREGLEFVVDSHLEGVEKPDPAIFRIALERMGVAPGRAVYVGDLRSVDEAGARAAGMHFVLLDPFGDYAGEHTPSIPSIDRLPAHLASRFAVPASGNGTS